MYTRQQNIELIEEYKRIGDMRTLDGLIIEVIKDKSITFENPEQFFNWHNLPDETLSDLSYLCAKESNRFDREKV